MPFTSVGELTEALGQHGGTTVGTLNLVGADLIVLIVGHDAGTSVSVSDSQGNVYVPIFDVGTKLHFFYKLFPSTSSAMVFNASGSNIYAGIFVLGFSAGGDLPALDQTSLNSGASFVTSIQVGTLTPSQNNDVLIMGSWQEGSVGSTIGVDNGLVPNPTWQIDAVGGVTFGMGAAYLIQTTATAMAPSMSWINSVNAAAGMVAFKVTAPSGPIILMGDGLT
jgi:hypothetical protein